MEATAGDTIIRFATFNASLYRQRPGKALAELSLPGGRQAAAVAEIIQRTRPDVLLINELDYEPGGALLAAFAGNYLAVSHHGSQPIRYPEAFVAPSNTGIPSGRDLDKDGRFGGPGDALGFGRFPGQYGMAVLSRYPIDRPAIRTFRRFLWRDLPGAMLPRWPMDPALGERSGHPFYDPGDLELLPLSSKSHWDVPIVLGDVTIHLLASHPTPPVFDGPERRNLWRNHDEIRLWADYITPGGAVYLHDDAGVYGGLDPAASFVIAGDLNADPVEGFGAPGAIAQLLDHPRVNVSHTPASAGGAWVARRRGHSRRGDPRHDTADFRRPTGNLRVDYVLPSAELLMIDAGIFWPTPDEPHYHLTGPGTPIVSSDHRLVWVDVAFPPPTACRTP